MKMLATLASLASGQWALVTYGLAALLMSAPPVLAANETTAEVDEGLSTVEQAIVTAKADIERDTDVLNALRADIAEQRRPLAARLAALQETVQQRREAAERLRRLRRQGEREQAALVAAVAAVEEDRRYLTDLLAEYSRAMETRIGAAEATRLVERLRPVRTALAAEDPSDGLTEAMAGLFALSAAANAERLGGFRFQGVALDADGVERQGRFAVFGPAAYFAAADGRAAGLAVTQFGAEQPAVYDRFPEETVRAVRALAEGALAKVPVDVTGGDAIKVAEARPTILAHVRKGGFVMIPLLIVALAAVVLAVWKAVELGGVHVGGGRDLTAVVAAVRQGDAVAARGAAERLRPPLRALAEEAIEHRDSPRDHLEEILHERVLAALPRLERNLGTLAVLGGVAPLLGLLGTVTGMIHTFQLVTIFGSGDAKLLSGGISEALVTTEAGLAIAIPVLLVHAFLARRARGIVGALERAAVALVNDLKVRSAGG